jgi:transmembrane sensor
MSRKTADPELAGLEAGQSADDQAIEWLARLRRPALDPEDAASFAAWLKQHPDNPPAFDRAAELWDMAGKLTEEAGSGAHTLVPANLPSSMTVQKDRRSRMIARAGWALAATVLFVLLGMQILGPAEVLQTLEGEQRVVDLEDGTRIWMNTASEVRIDVGSSGRRTVKLITGEVFFDVQHDSGRPFRIETESGSVEVLGTRFNVWQEGGTLAVDVETGRVRVFSRDHKREEVLSAGQGMLTDGSHRDPVFRSATRLQDWRDGRIVYDALPLAEVVKDLDRYLPGSVALADQELGQIEVSAVLRLEDQEAMLTALTTSLGLGWNEVQGGLKLISAQP